MRKATLEEMFEEKEDGTIALKEDAKDALYETVDPRGMQERFTEVNKIIQRMGGMGSGQFGKAFKDALQPFGGSLDAYLAKAGVLDTPGTQEERKLRLQEDRKERGALVGKLKDPTREVGYGAALEEFHKNKAVRELAAQTEGPLNIGQLVREERKKQKNLFAAGRDPRVVSALETGTEPRRRALLEKLNPDEADA